MDFNDLVTWYFERSSAMQTFWNFYITIVLALLAFFATVTLRAGHTKFWLAAVLSVAFLLFAAVNLGALLDVTRARNVAAGLIYSFHSDKVDNSLVSAIGSTVTPPSARAVIIVHIIGDILTVGGIWLLTWIRA